MDSICLVEIMPKPNNLLQTLLNLLLLPLLLQLLLLFHNPLLNLPKAVRCCLEAHPHLFRPLPLPRPLLLLLILHNSKYPKLLIMGFLVQHSSWITELKLRRLLPLPSLFLGNCLVLCLPRLLLHQLPRLFLLVHLL